jgi:hypothetical protein
MGRKCRVGLPAGACASRSGIRAREVRSRDFRRPAATEILLAQARGWAAKFLCMILIALIATLLDLLTEVFRAMSGRPAVGDPPSQETQPQMRAAYGS